MTRRWAGRGLNGWGGGTRYPRERTTHVGPLVVGNQRNKSVKTSLTRVILSWFTQLCEDTVEEGQPYKLPVGK